MNSAANKIVPPDGGWGWMVVLACGLNNMVMVPLIQGMGLIFVEIFTALNLPATQITIITSTNMSFGMAMGLIHGPLLRIFGYRKVALSGATLFATGILLTTFATKFTHFMVCYGLMTSFGVGLSMASFPLAVNTYFLKKRGRAMGLAMTLTGVGPIIMPQIISLLLYNYSPQGAILLLGAVTLHTFVAALLLQPIKWHTKHAVNELDDNQEMGRDIKVDVDNHQSDAVISDYYEGKHTTSVSSLNDNIKNEDLQALEIIEETQNSQVILVRHNSEKSFGSINLGSCAILFDDSMTYGQIPMEPLIANNKEEKLISNGQNNFNEHDTEKQILSNGIQKEEKLQKSTESCGKILRSIVAFFDLSLLCDPIYVNIMLGMAIATFSEMNFAILMVFMLDDINFTTSQIAASMSTMAAVDLIMRGFSPFIGEWLRQTPRVLYLISLAMLIISRTILIFCTGFIPVIIMSIGIGFAKGFRSVFMSLIVPNYIPLERLACATGIQTVVNGIILMVLGPAMGIIRESRGSYRPCIIILNAMSGLTMIMWIAEMILVKRIEKRKKLRQQNYNAVATEE